MSCLFVCSNRVLLCGCCKIWQQAQRLWSGLSPDSTYKHCPRTEHLWSLLLCVLSSQTFACWKLPARLMTASSTSEQLAPSCLAVRNTSSIFTSLSRFSFEYMTILPKRGITQNCLYFMNQSNPEKDHTHALSLACQLLATQTFWLARKPPYTHNTCCRFFLFM